MKKIVFLAIALGCGINILLAQKSQTFKIEKLEKATHALPMISPEALFSKYEKNFLHLSVTVPLVEKGTHPVLAGFLQAYQEHRPVTLSPDIVWLLICQGFTQHVNNNAKALRSKFVNFEGQKELTVVREVPGLVLENFPWESIFPEFVQKIGDYTGKELMNTLSANFTTTTPTSLITSQITIMAAMKDYFKYKVIMIGCGIPSVTLEGNVKDWEKILQKLDLLAQYDLEWWTKEIKPIIQEIIKTKRGKMDTKFWMNMVRFHGKGIYGSLKNIDGWLVKFYPYDRNGRRTNLQSISNLEDLPDEIARVPFTFVIPAKKQTYKMEFWAGFMGLSQDPQTFNLKPEIGWAINLPEETTSPEWMPQ